jgi:glycosyltransferase involved in cell wall biosynthesis
MQKMTVMIATAGGRADLLRRTLASIAAALRPQGYQKMLVVENGGRAVEAVVREFRGQLVADYLFFPKANKSAALTAALERIDDDQLLVFTDDDVRVDPHWLIRYEQASTRCGRGYFFGGPLAIDYPDRPPHPWTRPFLPASAAGWEWTGGQAVEEAIFLGANWAAFAGDLRAAGGFDVTRGPGAPNGSTGEESAMQMRLLACGMQGRYLPDAWVWHYVPAERCSLEWALDRAYRHGVSAGLEGTEAGWKASAPAQWARRVAGWLTPRRRFVARWWENYRRGMGEGERIRMRDGG